MKKTTLIQEIAEKKGLPKKEVEIVVDCLIETIVESIKEEEAVSFIGFGSFVPVKKNPREIFLPGADKKIRVKEKLGIRFKPSKKLKEILEKDSA
jgi:DNA-binding protein HU-beta